MSEENFDLNEWRKAALERMRRGETNIVFGSEVGDKIRKKWQKWREDANPNSKFEKAIPISRNDFLTEAENLISESLGTLRDIQKNTSSLPNRSYYYSIVLNHFRAGKSSLDNIVEETKLREKDNV